MVRRFVEQQYVRIAHQFARDGQPFRHPPDNVPAAAATLCKPCAADGHRCPGFFLVLFPLLAVECGEYYVVNGCRDRTRVPAKRILSQALAIGNLPESGSSIPARIFTSVDLPEPLGPIRPMRSPSEMVSEMFSNNGRAPNVFSSVRQLIRCAIANSIAHRDGLTNTLVPGDVLCYPCRAVFNAAKFTSKE